MKLKAYYSGLVVSMALCILPFYHMDLYPYNIIPAWVGGLGTGFFARQIYFLIKP